MHVIRRAGPPTGSSVTDRPWAFRFECEEPRLQRLFAPLLMRWSLCVMREQFAGEVAAGVA